jgi:hypothetical protein
MKDNLTIGEKWQVKLDIMNKRTRSKLYKADGNFRYKRPETIIAKIREENKKFENFYKAFFKALVRHHKVPKSIVWRAEILFRVSKNATISNSLSDIDFMFGSLLPAIYGRVQ